ncbi:hypothetical protein PGT21_020910 [Puccinia graminis f. sp. tritici]|uniref:Uncharacterized protein n=1 Tax=Puccinia graminis f. sp. tritici TaxID=56615 RepID=A0A5B0QAU4_PUCGR|nr:hypothetical protein PGT21_020910 [Puccinia graminis f. sp. tritici]
MFLVDWTQRTYIIYTVIMMMSLMPFVQLLESPKHSLGRRRVGNEPTQRCETHYIFRILGGHSICRNAQGQSYECDSGDCSGGELFEHLEEVDHQEDSFL